MDGPLRRDPITPPGVPTEDVVIPVPTPRPAGPWTKYKAAAPEAKPWEKYKPAPTPETAPEEGSFIPEIGKSVARGALGMAATAARGASALQQDPTVSRILDPVGSIVEAITGTRPSDINKALPQGKVNEGGLYKVGDAIDSVRNSETLKAADDYKDTWTAKIGEGVGSMGPLLIFAPFGAAGMTAGAFTSAAAGAGEAIENAYQKGADEETIRSVAKQGLVPGLTDQLPIETLLERVPVPVLGKFTSVVGKILRQALVEGGQEGAQQALQNLIAQYNYDPDQEISEGVLESMAIGGAVGGIVQTGKSGLDAVGVTGAGEPTPTTVRERDEDERMQPNPADPMFDGYVDAEGNPVPSRYPGEAVEPGGTPTPTAPATQGGAGDTGSPPSQPAPPAITPQQRAILRRAGSPDDLIDQMSPEEAAAEVEAEIANGTRVNQRMIEDAAQYRNPNTPAPQPPSMDQAADDFIADGTPPPPILPQALPDGQTPADVVQGMRERFNSPETQSQRAINRAENVAGQVRVPLDAVPETPAQTAQRMLGNYRAQQGQRNNLSGTRQRPAQIDAGEDLDLAGLVVNPEPTEAQKAAGNYRKYHAKINGFDVSIETPKGGIRSGTSLSGQPWQTKMPAHYGYIKRTEGADGDQLDVYVGNNPESKRVYVVDQRKGPGSAQFDEHKAIMGVGSVSEAREIYARGFSDGTGAQRIGAITPMSVSEFRKWLKEGDTSKPVRMGKPIPTNDQGFPIDVKGKVKKPESLIEFLARNGGIQDQNGDLEAIGLTSPKAGFVTGAGPLVRKTGMTLDAAREMALEAGYLTDPGAGNIMPSDSTITDLLDALDADSRNGRQSFSQYDQDHAFAWFQEQGSEAADDAQSEYDAALEEVVAATGLDQYDDFTQSAARVMVEQGVSVDDAVERVAFTHDNEVSNPAPETVLGEMPFFEDTPNEVQPGTTPQDSPRDGEAGQRGEERGTESEPQGSRPQTPDRGESGPQDGRQDDDGRGDQPGTSEDQAEVATAEPGADNLPQTVIPGAERITRKQQAERQAESPMRASKPQREAGGMFDEAETAPQLFDNPSSAVRDGESIRKGELPVEDDRDRQRRENIREMEGEKAKPTVSSNTIFTDDAAEKARALLKKKLSGNQLNSGIDPEVVQAGITLAGYHIEKGARTFSAYAKAMLEDMGDVVKPYLKSWYMGVKYDPRAAGLEGLSTASQVEDFDIASLDGPSNNDQTTPSEPEAATGNKAFDAMLDALLDPDTRFATITQARKLLNENGWEPKSPQVANKEAEELIEHAVVVAARFIIKASRSRGPKVTYDRLVDLYQRQPRLGSRTSTSMAEQAYSTPVPLAYVASRLAGIDGNKSVLEPTAGNGALLIEAAPAKAQVNELNEVRRENLKAQGFNPTGKDATDGPLRHRGYPVDVVIANPPFGAVRENGESKIFDIEGHRTTAIDHAIALNALSSMKEDGKAVLIVGSVKDGNEAQRAEGYGSSQKRKFYKRLYDEYNVTDHFTVSGDLYQRQGAAWPVDVIVIDGKGKSALKLPAATVPTLISDWNGLKGYLDDRGTSTRTGSQSVSQSVEGNSGPSGGSAGSSSTPSASRPVSGTTTSKPDTTASSPDPDRGQREPARVGELPSLFDDGGKPAGNDIVPPAKPREPRVKSDANESGQVPYRPYSREGTSLNTLVPAALGASMDQSLAKIEAKHGDIDAYVARELGYTLKELPDVFSAEQIDAIALAMENVANGDAFIIGDQTGIGKGRVVAAAIRFAHRKGMTPLFVTEKPDLYGDMFRDLSDIKWPKYLGREPAIFMTNSGTSVPLDDAAVEWIAERDEAKAAGRPAPAKRGRFMPAQNVKDAEQKMSDILSGAFKPDVVFTTYDQMNSVKGKETSRRRFMDSMAGQAFVIMDESHNAGGQGPDANARAKKGAPPPRSAKFREWVGKAKSVMYSSATYAKSPQVMDLYSRTDMAKAVNEAKDLPELIAKGGVPLQQIVSSMLAQSGQYARRERSFDGVEYRLEVAEVDQKSYADFATAMRSIYDFDRELSEFRDKWIKQYLAENGAGMGMDSGIGDMAANSTEFASIMHNIVNQMTLAIKADAAAKRAIKALNDGEKPVIALSFTSESFVKDYAEDKSISLGDDMPISFKDVVARYLERTLRITVKEADDTKHHVYIPVEELSPELLSMYERAQDALEVADLANLPVSPIDHIRNRVTSAGFSIREITGRSTMLDYSGDTTRFVARPSEEQGSGGKRVTIKKFNDGQVDAVILNRSGSTGVSMHASGKFKDKRKRRMILAQADPNIDTHMQMLGRVHRSGQVVLPAYSQLTADIPAEARPTAVLMKKMASLNANTTAARKSKFTADAVDFMNEYGDMAAIQWAKDNAETNMRLGSPVKFDEKGRPASENPIQKLTGRIMLLNPQEQQDLLDTLTDSYNAILAQKEAMGENALEAKAMDFQARPVDQTIIKPATGPSPFQGAAVLERMSIKTMGRAMKPAEVVSAAADALGGHDVRGMDFVQGLDAIAPKSRKWSAQTVEDMRPKFESWLQWTVGGLKNAESKRNQTAKANEAFQKWKEIVSFAPPGARVTLKAAGESDRTTAAVVIGVKQSGKGQNPLALSTWQVTFAMPDMSRTLTIPMSQLSPPSQTSSAETGLILSQPAWTDKPAQLAEQFEAAATAGREDRYIATGNILAAYDQLAGKGQIIQFTLENGDTQPGVLMPRDFKLDEWQKSRRIKFVETGQVMRFLSESEGKTVEDEKGIIRIESTYRGYEFELSSARAKGGVYFTDSSVRSIFDDWTKVGSTMTATVDRSTAQKLIAAMKSIGARFVAPTEADLAEKIVFGSDKQYSANPAPAPAGWGEADGGPVQTRLSNAEKQELADIVKNVSGLDPEFWETIPVAQGSKGEKAWGGSGTGTASGMWSAITDSIVLALDSATLGTAYHEAFHRIQDMYLNAMEKRLLARENARLRQIVATDYANSGARKPAQADKMSPKEIEAEAFRIYSEQMEANNGSGLRLHIGLRRAWERIRQTLRRIRNALNGMGYQTSEDVFKLSLRGDMAERGRVQSQPEQDASYTINEERVQPGTDPREAPSIVMGGILKANLKKMNTAAAKKGKNWFDDQAVLDDGESLGDLMTRKFEDYLDPLLRMQTSIQDAFQGGKVPASMNPYKVFRTANATAGPRIKAVHETYVQPALEELANANAEYKDLLDLLTAEHVEERNRVVGARNPEDSDMFKAITDPSKDGASGWSLNKANETIARLQQDREKYRALRRAAGMIRAMLRANLREQLKSGLISQDTYDLLTTQWQNYVPLKGMDGMDAQGGWIPKGKGFDVRGDEFEQAKGRKSEAEDVVAHAVSQTTMSITRQENNKGNKALLKLIANMDPEGEKIAQVYWLGDMDGAEFDGLDGLTKAKDVYRRTIVNGKVVMRKASNPFTVDNIGDVVAGKIGGKTFYIKFADPKVGLAIRKVNNVAIHALARLVRPFSVLQSIVNTRFNPEFFVPNLARDAQTAGLHMMEEGFSAKQIAKSYANLFTKIYPAIWRHVRGKPGNGEWDQVMAEFVANGGKMNFDTRALGFDEQALELQKKFKRMAGNNGKADQSRQAVEAILKFISDIMDVGENGMRLAIYKAARDRGEVPLDAVMRGREVTVDFERHGEWGPNINAGWVFFNAALQGNMNIVRRLARSKKLRAAAAGIMLGGVLQHLWNMAASGDDDDGESYYEKLLREEPYRFERQMLFFKPGGKEYYTIPLPYGYNAFWHAGVQGAAAGSGKVDPLAAGLDSFRVAVDAMNPLGSGSLATTLAPTILDPILEHKSNTNFFGGPIYPEENPFDQSPSPDSQRSFRNTSDAAKWVAETVNSVLGGNEIEPGLWDFHPETYQHVWGFFTGGIGRFADRSLDTALKALEGEFDPEKTPFVRSVYGEFDENNQRREYFNQRAKVQDVAGRLKDYQEKGDRAELKDFMERKAVEIQAINAYKAAEKQRRRINKARRAIEGNKNMAEASREKELERLDELELQVMKQARAAVAKARRDQSTR
jgi:hypothetical protein